MNNEHLTNEELQSYLDRIVVADEVTRVQLHLQVCTRCRNAYENLSELDASLKGLPIERVGNDFTRSVLARLNIAPKIPFLFRVVENLAYMFGLIIVLGVMLTVFLVSGVINKQQVVETQSTFSTASKVVGERLDAIAEVLTAGLQTYLPFMFGGGSLKIALMGTLVMGMLALLDKFLKRRFHV